MATSLHKAIGETKNIFKWIGIILGVIIFIVLTVRIVIAVNNMINPPKAPPSTVAFGKLTEIKFPPSKTVENLSYIIDTTTGMLPFFGDRAPVYKIYQPEPDLLALQKTQEKVNKYGFPPQGTQLSDTKYAWTNSSPPYKTITVDILSSNFNISSRFMSDQNIIQGQNFSTQEKAIEMANSFISSISPVSDLDDAKTKITLLTASNGNLTATTSLSNTQIFRIDFFQKDIPIPQNSYTSMGVPSLKIYYPNPFFSTMNVFIGAGGYEGQIVQGDFFHQNIAPGWATYPMKTTQEALEELKKGNGYIATYNGNKEIKIKNVYIGFYMADYPQEYLMPIFVFEGDNDFFAYVSAVKDEWIQN